VHVRSFTVTNRHYALMFVRMTDHCPTKSV